MNLLPWDPGKELERLRERTERLWDEFLQKLTHDSPAQRQIAFMPDVDFVETSTEYRLYLSMPGLIEEDIDILIDEFSVTIRGERQPPYDPQHADRCVREWRYGFCERQFRLPQSVQPNTLRATYEDGVLTVILNKSAAA